MEAYFGTVLSSLLSTLFFVFLIAALGYMVGGIEIKGISLGTAGVLLVALVYGIIANGVGSFTIGGKEIVLFNNETVKPMYSLISSLGTALFVTAVGLMAGPKFFRTFNKASLAYILMGVVVIGAGVGITVVIRYISGMETSMAVGLLTGALTSTPGLSAAKDAAANTDAVTAGYGIAYLFGVLGVVFFVQLVPKFGKVNMEEERKRFVAANTIDIPAPKRKVRKMDALDFFPFMLTVVLGMILGAIRVPGTTFSLGTSGGTLIMGLVLGHFGHICGIDLRISKYSINSFRELGLMLFLIGAGVPGGVNFVSHVKAEYFLYGAIMTLVPMLIGFLLGKYVFKLSIFNNLGSITGGMTSTPALGTLIHVAGTEDVASAYAATYPIALVMIVMAAKLIAALP